jgi:6-phosphogluconate dehydrogenase (decarboxylating)
MTAAQDERVAVLGTGIMGSAMARNLLAAGLATTVWDRSASATAPLAQAGARVAPSAADAVADARLVIMMLPTAEVVTAVLFDAGVAPTFADGAVCAQMGTIGVDATVRIAGRLGQIRPDVGFVDAPVSGSKGPAESGQLLILASGPADAEPVVRPAFAAIGRALPPVARRRRRRSRPRGRQRLPPRPGQLSSASTKMVHHLRVARRVVPAAPGSLASFVGANSVNYAGVTPFGVS